MWGPDEVTEVDVAAVVAEELARHAPGTAVAGPASGGVQVIRVEIELAPFRALLAALAATLDAGSHVRLDAHGGVIHLDVTDTSTTPEQLAVVRDRAIALGGEVAVDPAVAHGYSVRLPSGLSGLG